MYRIRYLFFVTAVVILGFLLTGEITADTIVNGEVSGHWQVRQSPYVVNGDIVLLANDSLIIDPGVIVRFGGGTRFDVYGLLIARGTVEDSIRFIATVHSPGAFRWIKFDGNGTSGSVMDFCRIQYAYHAIHLANATPTISNCNISFHERTGVLLEGSGAQISNCIIANIGHNGISVTEGSRASLFYNEILNCTDNGIVVSDRSNPNIKGNSIFNINNFHGIALNIAGACSLSYNQIIQCGQRGIYITQTSNVIALRNVVHLCHGDYAVYFHRTENILALNNTIYENDRTGLGVANGNAQLINNIIALNGLDGVYAQGGVVNNEYNDVWMNNRDDYNGLEPHHTNISANPELVNPALRDYSPREGSPVIDAGNPRYRDADATRADIGAMFFNQNHPPEITSYSPDDFDRIQGDQEITFSVQATDADGHPFTYLWLLDDQPVEREQSYTNLFNHDGNYTVTVIVDDHYYMGQSSHEWSFEVYGSSAPVIEPNVPAVFRLSEPYPNPFNDEVRFSFETAKPGVVNISVKDFSGRKVSEIWSGEVGSGTHDFVYSSTGLSVGSYILVAEFNGDILERKLIVLK